MTAVDGSPVGSSDSLGTQRIAADPSVVAEMPAVGTGPIETHRRIALGRFRIVAVLGSGSMGEVLLAEDTLLSRRVAIKRLRPELAGDPRHRERLRNEARIAVQLDHPAIVRVLDLLRDDGVDHIVMEYVAGPSLRALRSRRALPIPEVVQIAAQVVDALDHVHRRGVVHCDLKLENVLTTRDGRPKLNDFGIARSVACVGCDEIIGTPRAMSPEQISGAPIDGRSDLFSVGVLLHELVTGVSPFAADGHAQTMAHVLFHRPPSLAAGPGVPPALAALVEHLLEKDPACRPQRARDVAVRLRAIEVAARAGALQ